METQSEQFCPVCKLLVEPNAVHCSNCGTVLFGSYDHPSTTAQVGEEEDLRALVDSVLIEKSQYPEKGIAVYLFSDTTTPISTQLEDEFILGRKTGITSPVSKTIVLDLESYNGYSLGVSRRHALIRKTENGYEILDLESTNGSQVNAVRMTPKQPYKLENGAVIRVGNLFLFVVFRSKSQDSDS